MSEQIAEHNNGNALRPPEVGAEMDHKPVNFESVPAPLFILGAPRSFTSVACAMIGQHPQMYGLPELHPFVAETMDRRASYQDRVRFNINAGLLRTVAELFFGSQTAETIRLARGWLRRRAGFSPAYIIEEIGGMVSPRTLVEKSPSTGRTMEYLERASNMFPHAHFLHLVRHPQSQCESMLSYCRRREMQRQKQIQKSKLHSRERGPIGMNVDPQNLWLRLNANISRFLLSVPGTHQMRVRGEDLLIDPDRHLREIALWLGIRNDPEAITAMKHPEQSPYACLGPPGAKCGNDVLFLENPVLRPSRAGLRSLDAKPSWGPETLLPQVKRLARKFGYE